MSVLMQDRMGDKIQGFAPVRVETVAAAGSLDTTDVLAIRTSGNADYQINGAGTVATMPAGVTVIGEAVVSLKFAAETTVEVME